MPDDGLDFAATSRLLDALYQPGDQFFLLAYHDRNRAYPTSQSAFTYGMEGTYERFLEISCRLGLATAASVGVFLKPTGDAAPRRTEDRCVGLSAFAVDVDAKNFPALVPDAATVDQVAPEVVRRMHAAGILPHALVRSGRGLHVYVLIERLLLASDAQRAMTKDLWFRLTHLLGGARDRFDLSSMMRVPGTLNRKGNPPARVEFVEEHTDLRRARYRIDEVVAALSHLPDLHHEAHGRRPAQAERYKSGLRAEHEVPEADSWDGHVLNVALALDTQLVEARKAAVAPPRSAEAKRKTDRSRNDFHYACRLLEVGLPRPIIDTELENTARGSTETKRWRDSTFRKAMAKVCPVNSDAFSVRWRTSTSGGDAVFTGIEEPARAHQDHLRTALVRGDFPASISSMSPEPAVTVVLARPGQGKTRGVVGLLAQVRQSWVGRLGFCSSMVRELLRHEYAINAAFPWGLIGDINDQAFEFSLDLPEDHASLLERLPRDVKELIDPDLPDEKLTPLWTVERLNSSVTDPGAFFINAHHPGSIDEGLEPYENEDGPVLPPWASSWDDPVLKQPRAVVKFRARADLCLENRRKFTRRTCLECGMAACRANMNARIGGAKTFWTDAPFALLSHKAYETHLVVKPSLNRFDGMVFDELPGLVFRYAKLKVSPAAVRNGRAVGWLVEPIDSLLEHIARVGRGTKAEATLEKLSDALSRLKKRASDLMHKAQAGELHRGMVRLDRMDPLLSSDEFRALVEFAKDEVDEEIDPEPSPDESAIRVLGALTVLRDYSGSAKLDVFIEADFDRSGEGSMWVCRPVNGWPDLLCDPEGRARPTVLLDASAGLDPRYLLAGQWETEEAPPGFFPGTTIVLTSERTVSRSKAREAGPETIAARLVERVRPHLDQMVCSGAPQRHPGEPRLLVVTAKSAKPALESALAPYIQSGKLPVTLAVEHFGGLRGRNDFRDFDGVYFTHLHLYDDGYFFGLELLLRDFAGGFDRQWVKKAKWYNGVRSRLLQYRAQAADIYQDALRIGIRSDPSRRAFIFIPTAEAPYVVRLLRLFRGASLVLPDGRRISPPLQTVPREGVASGVR